MSDLINEVLMGKLFGTGTGSGGSSGGGDEKSLLDALIDGSITEISNDTVKYIKDYKFYNHDSLVEVIFSAVTSVGSYAFQDCSTLTKACFPAVKNVGNYIFKGSTVKELRFDSLESIASTSAFEGCSKLETIHFPLLRACIQANAFRNAKALKKVRFPAMIQVGPNFVGGCTALRIADFSQQIQLGYQYAFSGCSSFVALVLRSETCCTLGNTNNFYDCYHFLGTVDSTYNPDGLKDGYIYVPRALVDAYKAATNWSTFADQFRALEDYTVDGTITGELDESKI